MPELLEQCALYLFCSVFYFYFLFEDVVISLHYVDCSYNQIGLLKTSFSICQFVVLFILHLGNFDLYKTVMKEYGKNVYE